MTVEKKRKGERRFLQRAADGGGPVPEAQVQGVQVEGVRGDPERDPHGGEPVRESRKEPPVELNVQSQMAFVEAAYPGLSADNSGKLSKRGFVWSKSARTEFRQGISMRLVCRMILHRGWTTTSTGWRSTLGRPTER